MPGTKYTAINLTSAYLSGNQNHLLFLQMKDGFSQMKSAHQTVINLPPLGLMLQASNPSLQERLWAALCLTFLLTHTRQWVNRGGSKSTVNSFI